MWKPAEKGGVVIINTTKGIAEIRKETAQGLIAVVDASKILMEVMRVPIANTIAGLSSKLRRA